MIPEMRSLNDWVFLGFFFLSTVTGPGLVFSWVFRNPWAAVVWGLFILLFFMLGLRETEVKGRRTS